MSRLTLEYPNYGVFRSPKLVLIVLIIVNRVDIRSSLFANVVVCGVSHAQRVKEGKTTHY